jgi:hypothetical protein
VGSIVVMLLRLRDGRSQQQFEKFFCHIRLGFDCCHRVAILNPGDARNNALLARN